MIAFGHPPRPAQGLIGTWVKIPALETVELLGLAGFDFVVIDLEHAPLNLETAYDLIVAAQAAGMAALVRLSDRSGAQVQRLLDAGADGLLVPHVSSIAMAQRIAESMVFAPRGTRGLGATSRAGGWGMVPLQAYLDRGDRALRMVQLESWEVLQDAASYLAIDHVSGVFVGLGDLFLSSGRTPADEETRAMVRDVATAAQAAGKACGIAAANVEEAREYLAIGYSLVMVSNDATLFGKAAQAAVQSLRA
jgi:2-dehydro-3-deoxyglucarate aldolase/4-hydroxy-2-oxoheptanedioate aldolase